MSSVLDQVDNMRMVMRLLSSLMAIVVLGALLAGCAARPDEQAVSSYVDGRSTTSPLSAYGGAGGFAADPARHVPWDFSLGQFFLCVTKPGTEATITEVVPHVSRVAPPFTVTTWMRTTTREAVQRTLPARREDFAGVNSIGSPPGWRDPERTFAGRGRWSRQVSGTRVTTPCQQRLAQQDDVTAGRVQRASAVQELVFTLTVGRAGGAVDGFAIHFVSGGRRGILHVLWDITACGSSRFLRPRCAHGRG